MPWRVSKVVWTGALIGSVAWAVWKGGREERAAAAALIIADVAALLHPHQALTGFDWTSLTLDVSLLAYFGYRAAVTNRWWPLYACAAQLAVVIGLTGFIFGSGPLTWTYLTLSAFWSYAILLALVAGTTLERDRVREERS